MSDAHITNAERLSAAFDVATDAVADQLERAAGEVADAADDVAALAESAVEALGDLVETHTPVNAVADAAADAAEAVAEELEGPLEALQDFVESHTPVNAVIDEVENAVDAVAEQAEVLGDIIESHVPLEDVGKMFEDVGEEVGAFFGGRAAPPEDRTRDSDSDGVTDWDERNIHGTDPVRWDTDGDGLGDGRELREHGTDPNDGDSDSDGFADGDELRRGTDPYSWDTDGDGWSDGMEARYTDTDPLRRDTDGDGLTDRDEGMVHRTDPNEADSDNDGLRDGREVERGYDPNAADTDGNGTSDGAEVAFDDGTWMDEEASALGAADDSTLEAAAGDVIEEGLAEQVLTTVEHAPLTADAAGGQPQDPIDVVPQQNMMSPTTGVLPPYMNSSGGEWRWETDSDGDGVSDWLEEELGTDPHKWDTDGDGLSDGEEYRDGLVDYSPVVGNVSALGIDPTDPLNPDTDGDGASDRIEYLLDHGAHHSETPEWGQLGATGGLEANTAATGGLAAEGVTAGAVGPPRPGMEGAGGDTGIDLVTETDVATDQYVEPSEVGLPDPGGNPFGFGSTPPEPPVAEAVGGVDDAQTEAFPVTTVAAVGDATSAPAPTPVEEPALVDPLPEPLVAEEVGVAVDAIVTEYEPLGDDDLVVD